MIIRLGEEHKTREEDVGRMRRGLAEKPAHLICNLLSLMLPTMGEGTKRQGM